MLHFVFNSPQAVWHFFRYVLSSNMILIFFRTGHVFVDTPLLDFSDVFSWLDWFYVSFRGRLWGQNHFYHIISDILSTQLITADLELDYLARVVLLGFLHWKVIIFLPYHTDLYGRKLWCTAQFKEWELLNCYVYECKHLYKLFEIVRQKRFSLFQMYMLAYHLFLLVWTYGYSFYSLDL